MRILIILALLVSFQVHGQTDSVRYYKGKLDTANYELYMANQQVNAVKFYMKLCEWNKNPRINKQHLANHRFFYNWVTTRAMVPHPVYDSTPPKTPTKK